VSQGRVPCGMALSGTRRSKGGSCSRRALMPRWNTARSAKPTGRRKAAGPLKTAPSAPTVRLRSVTPGCPGVQAVCGPRQTCATSAARAAAPSARPAPSGAAWALACAADLLEYLPVHMHVGARARDPQDDAQAARQGASPLQTRRHCGGHPPSGMQERRSVLVTCSALQTARAQRCSSVVGSDSGGQVALHEGARDRLQPAECVVGCRGTRNQTYRRCPPRGPGSTGRRSARRTGGPQGRTPGSPGWSASTAVLPGAPPARVMQRLLGCHCLAHKAPSAETAATTDMPARPTARQCLQRLPHIPQQLRCHLLLRVLPCRAHISRFDSRCCFAGGDRHGHTHLRSCRPGPV